MFLLKTGIFSLIYIYTYIVFYFLYVDARKTEDQQWILLVRSRTKSKKWTNAKKTRKHKQKLENKQIPSRSSDGNTTVTDEDAIENFVWILLHFYV